jgi:hypothetical protein
MFEDVLSRQQGNKSVVLRGRQLQVICKLAEYRLEPGQSHEGVWHLEGTCCKSYMCNSCVVMIMHAGMVQEGIVATGIHYLQTSQSMVRSWFLSLSMGGYLQSKFVDVFLLRLEA